MLAEEILAYRRRWEKVEEYTRRERLSSSPETRLRQTLALLQLANLLGWRSNPADIDAVRQRWRRLRAALNPEHHA